VHPYHLGFDFSTPSCLGITVVLMFKRRGSLSQKKTNQDAPTVGPVPEELELSSESEVEVSEGEEELSEATDVEADLPSASDLSSGEEDGNEESESDEDELDGALLDVIIRKAEAGPGSLAEDTQTDETLER
jgi:hypothetical protein